MERFTQEEANAVKRLLSYAYRKSFVADLLLNTYDSSHTVSMQKVMRYAAGETANSSYRDDVFVLLSLMERGVETHEVIGPDVIYELVRHWRKDDPELSSKTLS